MGYFLWASKESDSAARMADEKTQGREPVFARRTTSKTKSKWIPAFAGMTALKAFAGMTTKRHSREAARQAPTTPRVAEK